MDAWGVTSHSAMSRSGTNSKPSSRPSFVPQVMLPIPSHRRSRLPYHLRLLSSSSVTSISSSDPLSGEVIEQSSSGKEGTGNYVLSSNLLQQEVPVMSEAETTQQREEKVLTEVMRVQQYDTLTTVGNAILLAVSFGWVAWTILTIDSGMTRGWTQSEIAMRIPLDNWASYEMSLEQKPIYTKTLINVVIYLLGDWLSQTIFQGKNILHFDAVRTLKNGFIGLCFGPLVHEYYQFSDHILPVDGPNSMIHRVEKIFMDQTIYLSVKASIYVAAVSLLGGESWQQAQQNVKDRIRNICFTAWKFWPLVHCLTYTIIPAQHRILWVNCVDLVWNAILASISRAQPVAVPPSDIHTEELLIPTTALGNNLIDGYGNQNCTDSFSLLPVASTPGAHGGNSTLSFSVSSVSS